MIPCTGYRGSYAAQGVFWGEWIWDLQENFDKYLGAEKK